MKDRISELPDSLLHNILSLLPMKLATRASILSKRWRNLCNYLWIHATILDFGEEFAKAQTQEQFVNSVNRYLQINNCDRIDELRLFFYPGNGNQYRSDIEKWIEFAILKRIKKLNLNLCQGKINHIEGEPLEFNKEFKLPTFVFGCDSLTHLNLNHCDFSPPSKFTGFNSLEILELRDVSIADNSLESLLSSCPFLSKLSLRECSNLESINVKGPNLRLSSLIVGNCDAYGIEIFAPNLKSFHYYGDVLYEYLFENISSLEDFFISADGYEHTEPEHDFVQILSGVSHIKILTVCTAPLLYFSIAEIYLPEDLPVTLPNLQELQLLMGNHFKEEYLGYIYVFFKHFICPSLEKLFIEGSFSATEDCFRMWFMPQIFSSPSYYPPWTQDDAQPAAAEPSGYVFHNLLMVKINHFRGSETEMRMVKFILDRAVVLASLVLVSPHNSQLEKGIGDDVNVSGSTSQVKSSETPSKVLRDQLQSMPKASKDAQIVLCEHWEVDANLFPTHTEYYWE